jgi:hypothetical protein
VLALTVLPRANCPPGAQFEAQRSRLNDRIRANWAVFADGLVDVAADGRIGAAGASLDQQYYTDGVHLNARGYAIVAQAVVEGIRGLKLENAAGFRGMSIWTAHRLSFRWPAR